MRRLAAALAGPGNDPRLWVAYGTVSTGAITSGPDDDVLSFDIDDPQAVQIGPAGVMVDVVLEPSLQTVTCHYSGIQGGKDCVVLAPIFTGDRVLVAMPDGSLGGSGPPVILAILNSDSEQIPLGPDQKPLFQNDRVLIWAKDVPIDIRTAGGSRVEINEDGTVVLNEGTKGAARLDDQTTAVLSGLQAPITGSTQADAIAQAAAVSDLYKLIAAIFATGVFASSASPVALPAPDTSIPGTITSASATVKAGD